MTAMGAGSTSLNAISGSSMPELVELRDRGHTLRLRWPDGLETTLGAATLRNACRCATCTHSMRSGEPVHVDAQVRLRQVAEVGVAGLQLVFSDDHRRGIFPWQYLRQLASKRADASEAG